MKLSSKIFLAFLFCLSAWCLGAQTQVTYNLRYDSGTETYIVSMRSNLAHNPPLSRISNSTQVTLVVPDGWQMTSLTGLISGGTALIWGASMLDGATHSLSKDYFFIAPSNSGLYTPFTIPANTDLDLFSFKRNGSGCIGDLALYDNTTDPLNMVPMVNADNNIVILSAGMGNKYVGNTSGAVSCAPCAANAGTLSY